MATDYSKCSIGVALGDAFNTIATTMSIFGELLRYMWLRPPSRRVYQPHNTKMGKEHKGYARPSRQRLVQRKG